MKILSRILALMAVVSLSSCIELNSLIVVNKDGSGTIEETVLLGAQLKAMMSAMPPTPPGAPADPNNPMAALSQIVPDQKQAEKNAKSYGEGVTVKSVEEVNLPDGRGGVKVTYAYTDINKLSYQPGNDKASEVDPNAKQEAIRFSLQGDELVLNIPQGNADSLKKPSKEELKEMQDIDPAQMAMMKPMFAGMRIAFAVKAAGGIASSDASHQNGDTVTVLDMQVDKLFDNPEAFKKFAKLMESQNQPDPKQLAEEFKSIDGIKIEDKEKVTIKLR